MNPIMSNVGEQSMSTPNPRHCKLDGLALYAPRRARTQPTTAEERWRAKLDRIAAAIASVEAIEAERGGSSTPNTFRLAKPAHDAWGSTSDIVEALEAEHDFASDDDGAAVYTIEPAAAERDSGKDVGSSAPDTIEAPETERSVESLAPDIQRAISLALGLPTPDSPSPPDEAADRPPRLSIQQRLIGSGATVHDPMLSSLPHDPETLAKSPIRAPYPAAPPLFARISLVTGVAAMATFGLAIVLNVPSDGHARKNASNNLVLAQAAGAPNAGAGVAALGSRQERANAAPSDSIASDSTAPSAEPLNNEQAALLLQRGRDLLQAGDVTDARLAFQVLAERGDADAALALATTFDQRSSAVRNGVGVVPDDARARAWYRRAMALGSSEAKRALIQMATQ
jgi:hypothetical protein